jgi:nucleoside-diphosphate-sugar epimerase
LKSGTDGSYVISQTDQVLVTGAAGFIGSRVVEGLIERGFRNIMCFARPSSKPSHLKDVAANLPPGVQLRFVSGNLLSKKDCETACKDAALIIHLAAGTGEKSFPDAFMNSVVATRNLLDAAVQSGNVRRLVLISSFSVYTNCKKPHGRLLDETCPTEDHGERRGEAYCFAKYQQEKIVSEYNKKYGLPYVVVRPGSVYGAGKGGMVGRVGIDSFGVFLHIGGSNKIPFTYVDNCADAIVLAGLVKGVDGEIFNVVDDDLPSSRQFLRAYKKNVKKFRSIYLPHFVSYVLCYMWEKYWHWSEGQLPLAFNRKRWHTYWKKTRYSNQKLKTLLGWNPKVSTKEAMRRFFESCKHGGSHA